MNDMNQLRIQSAQPNLESAELEPPDYFESLSAAGAEETDLFADVPLELPRTHHEQRLVRRMFDWQQLRGAEQQGDRVDDLPDTRVMLVSEGVRQEIAAELDAQRGAVHEQLMRGLQVSPFAGQVVAVTSRSKTPESTLGKLERRAANPEAEGCAAPTAPVSDLIAFRVILRDRDEGVPFDAGLSPSLNFLHYTAGYFGVPRVWSTGKQTINTARNPWSHPEHQNQQAKLYAMVNGEMVLFEVQAYTEAEYAKYLETREYYERNRAQAIGQLALWPQE